MIMEGCDLALDDLRIVADSLGIDSSSPHDLVVNTLRSRPLLQLCSSMRDLLCEESTVAAGMRALAYACIKRDFLEEREIQVIGTFFCSKALSRDLAVVAVAILRLLVEDLVSRHHCHVVLFNCIMTEYFCKIELQKLPLPLRKDSYDILNDIVCEETLGNCDSDLLRVILDSVDGEGEPVLVMKSFDLLRRVLDYAKQSALKDVIQDYFDCIASYFPVVFTQPPSCPVTKKMLQIALGGCLTHVSLSEYCMPFLLGKLSSPSIIVKQEVVDALGACVQSYSLDYLEGHLSAVVTQVRNEIMKLTAYPEYQSNDTLTRCLAVLCDVLTTISTKLAEASSAKALEVFSPITEGALGAVGAATTSSSAYATMLHSIMKGSWSVCLTCGNYALTMLLLSSPGFSDSSSLMLLTAIISGFITGMDEASCRTEAAEDLQERIRKVTPTLCAMTLQVSQDIHSGTHREVFVLICTAEFISSVLSLAHALEPWMSAPDAEVVVRALVHLASGGFCCSVAKKARNLISNFASQDRDIVSHAVSLLVAQADGVTAQQGIAFLSEVASSSKDMAIHVLNYTLDSASCPASSWLAAVPVLERAKLSVDILNYVDVLEETVAIELVTKIRATQMPGYFESLCAVLSRSGANVVRKLEEEFLSLDIVTVAAMTCFCPGASLPDPNSLCAKFNDAAATAAAPAFLFAVLNGITGVVSNHPGGATGIRQPLVVAGTVALLWGTVLASSESVGTTSSKKLLTEVLLETTDEETLSAVFSFFPLQAKRTTQRGSLLSLLLSIEDRSIVRLPGLWQGLLCLIDREASEVVQQNEPLILRRLQEGCTLGVPNELSFGVLSVLVNSSTTSLCESAILQDSTLFDVVLSGLGAGSSASRCSSLRLLTKIATATLEKMATVRDDPVQKSMYLRVRNLTLEASEACLSDKKRRVRQDAAWCRHAWFKVK